jgi:hypothetical protein
VFRPATAHSARGLESVSAILFDEAAFVHEIDEIYGSALPATEMLGQDPINGAKIIILSTPNGRQGFYWQRVNEENPVNVMDTIERIKSEELPPYHYWTDRGGWCKFIAHWKAHPIYSKRDNYLLEQKVSKRLTEGQVQREYNLSFDDAIAVVYKEHLVLSSIGGAWQPAEPGHFYLVGIDPSFGGEDFYTVRVWDISTAPYQLVAQYRDRFRLKDIYLSNTISLLEPYFEQWAYAAIETNGGGALVFQDLQSKRPYWAVEGININNNSKILHTDRLVLQLERGEMSFPPEPENALQDDAMAGLVTYGEYTHFIEEVSGRTRTRSAESGYHDDTVMADAVAFAMLETAIAAMGDSSWLDSLK